MAEAHATETVDSLLRYERKDINWFRVPVWMYSTLPYWKRPIRGTSNFAGLRHFRNTPSLGARIDSAWRCTLLCLDGSRKRKSPDRSDAVVCAVRAQAVGHS